MAIDQKLVEMLGLDQGALAKRSKTEQAWLSRLLKEVVDPFGELLKQHQEIFLAKGMSPPGLTLEMMMDVVEFNESVHNVLALMLATFVVSNHPPTEDLMYQSIKLTANNLSNTAINMCKQAKAEQREKEDKK
jgi:predicted transcriptional regulator